MYFIKIPQPAVALNAYDPNEKPNEKGEYAYRVPECRYKMWKTYDVPQSRENAEMFNRVNQIIGFTKAKRLKSLVINCHGLPGELHIAKCIDIQNVDLFGKLKGKVDVIYITACFIAKDEKGKQFCQQIAIHSQAVVYAPSELQAPEPINIFRQKLRYKIDPFEGPVWRFFPNGFFEQSIELSNPSVESKEVESIWW